MPTNWQHDYELVTSGSGYVELSGCSTLRVTGEDRSKFLHNFCTNDINRLLPGERCEAFLPDVKGKIVGHVFVSVAANEIVLLCINQQAEAIISHLDRYIIREDVQLTDHSTEYRWLLFGHSKPSAFSPFPSISEVLPGSLIGVPENKSEQANLILHKKELTVCDNEVFNVVRIENKLPLFDIDFDDSNLPQEIDRDQQAINFNKGCYLGQETIARIDALGHVNKKTVQLGFEGSDLPPQGLELHYHGKSVGKVTSRCWSPKFKRPIALAMIRRDANQSGTLLDSDFGPAVVLD